MPAADPKKVESIFLALVELPEAERSSTLKVVCDGDAELQREIESLLRFHDAPGDGALDRSPLLNLTAGLAATIDENRLPPRPTAAGFTLQSVLGSGGMGVVYVAQQHRPRRTVALKVIRRGFAGQAMLRRFEHEAEVLARLQHPGIAQIFQAGVADFGHGPQPFIAMELVPGSNLLEFAQQHHLSTRDRLELVARVCDAVQHAHQRGVIHRDLKPANILVASRDAEMERRSVEVSGGAQSGHAPIPHSSVSPSLCQPKILDFGVARVTDADLRATSHHTGLGQLIGTLPYMSPEQVLADPNEIDTRSDVYALGVILFELLAGRLPHDLASRSVPEAARVIREEQPARLSAIDRLFRGDIDTIVSKSLEKDPNRRYQSAAELGADLRRYLNNEPIVARRASPIYQFRKFAGRNRAAMFIAAALVLVMIGATIVSALLALSAAAARDRAIDAGRLAEVRAYQAGIAAADAALQKNDVASAQRRLQAVPAEFQNTWELRYLVAQVDDSIATLALEETSAVYAARFSPDSSKLAVASYDRQVRIWDTATRHVLATWSGHELAVTALAWSPDGARVASGSRDKTVRVWDAATGQTQLTLTGHRDYVNTIEFSRDGRRILSASSDGRAIIWDAVTGQLQQDLSIGNTPINCAAFVPRSERVVTAARDGVVRLHALDEPQDQPRSIATHRIEALAVAVSPGGRLLASAGRDGVIRVWDLQADESRHVLFGHDGGVRTVAFSPDSRLLASAGDDGVVRIWDTVSGALVIALTGHRANVAGVEFSPDGALLASCSSESVGTVRLWAAPRLPMNALVAHAGPVQRIALSPDGRWLASGGSDKRVIIWDTRTSERVAWIDACQESVSMLTFTPDSRMLISGSRVGDIRYWDADTTSLIAEQEVGGPGMLTPSEDGSHFAVSTGGVIDLYDTTTRRLAATIDVSPHAVDSIAISAGARLMAANIRDGEIRIWDVASSELITTMPGQGAGPRTMRFSRDGRVLVVGSGGRTSERSVRLFDVRSGTELARLTGMEVALESVAITADNSRVAAGTAEGDIWMWDARNGMEVLVLRDHQGGITGLDFSADGSQLYSSSRDQRIRIWDTIAPAERFARRRECLDLRNRVEPMVSRLFEAHAGDARTVAAALRADVSLDPPLRDAALSLTLRRGAAHPATPVTPP